MFHLQYMRDNILAFAFQLEHEAVCFPLTNKGLGHRLTMRRLNKKKLLHMLVTRILSSYFTPQTSHYTCFEHLLSQKQ